MNRVSPLQPRNTVVFLYVLPVGRGVRPSSVQGLLFIIAVCGFLVTVASLGAEQKLQACGFQYLWHTGSVVARRRSLWTLKCGFQ